MTKKINKITVRGQVNRDFSPSAVQPVVLLSAALLEFCVFDFQPIRSREQDAP